MILTNAPFVAMCLAFPLVANAQIEPVEPPSFEAKCISDRSCFYDGNCPNFEGIWRLRHVRGSGFAELTSPNGSLVLGPVYQYYRHTSDLLYIAFFGSDGSGATHLTVFPNSTFVLTGHLTLAENTALTNFGVCDMKLTGR